MCHKQTKKLYNLAWMEFSFKFLRFIFCMQSLLFSASVLEFSRVARVDLTTFLSTPPLAEMPSSHTQSRLAMHMPTLSHYMLHALKYCEITFFH